MFVARRFTHIANAHLHQYRSPGAHPSPHPFAHYHKTITQNGNESSFFTAIFRSSGGAVRIGMSLKVRIERASRLLLTQARETRVQMNATNSPHSNSHERPTSHAF